MTKLSKEDAAFYGGIISALAVCKLHDQEVIFHEIVQLCDLEGLLTHAEAEDELEFSGLEKYGYKRYTAAEVASDPDLLNCPIHIGAQTWDCMGYSRTGEKVKIGRLDGSSGTIRTVIRYLDPETRLALGA